MTCRELIDFLDRYVSRRLEEDVQRRFDEHLGLCPECRDYLDSYEKTVSLGRRAFNCESDQPPEGMPEDLVDAILAVLAKRPGSGGSTD